MVVKLEIQKPKDIINIHQLKNNNRALHMGLISPAREEVCDDVVVDKAAEPIKSIDDIDRISKYLISNNRYRDNMMFIVGINFGLRVSDLRVLRFSTIINENYSFRSTFPVFEKKTRNTRKKKINRYITINEAVIEAVTLYLEHTSDICLSDYMFRSTSNNGKNNNIPLTSQSINEILRKIAKELKLSAKVSSHTLRKTFCYHQMVMSGNSHRKLLLLQKMLNHSSPSQTLDYIGITSEEIEEAYLRLNLGSEKYNYLKNTDILEGGVAHG